MAYCAPRGIPYSVFMGRDVAPGEPAWTEEDTALAIEWQRIQDTTCAGCGQPLAECLTDDGGYETAVVRCHGCKAKEKRAEELGKLSDTAGVKVVVHRLPEGA
ncbi:hypothetical protein O1L44_16280 [Streptomyces noursei]|nr:hypothetical protein SNOUR_20830 [Streptomyces noursei ATCC 11455]MCZ0994347.1 hypothetical protein [Streptomyces noursei]